jgi:hypothetical protein
MCVVWSVSPVRDAVCVPRAASLCAYCQQSCPVAHKPSVPSTHRRHTGRQCPKQLVSRHPSQFPVAHRPSLVTPRSGDGLPAVPATRDQRPSRRAQGIQRPSPGAPRATAPLHRPPAAFTPAGPEPGQAPDLGPRLRHRGYEHWPTKIHVRLFLS